MQMEFLSYVFVPTFFLGKMEVEIDSQTRCDAVNYC